MSEEFDLDAFVRGRDAALQTLDEAKIRAFYVAFPDVVLPRDRLLFWATIHKAITAARSIPLAVRRRSKNWLTERGLASMDDGEL